MRELLERYPTITLEEMGSVRLMNRTDTKFVTTTALLPDLLAMAQTCYRVQVVEGLSVANYHTLYFDTPDHRMFRAHQCGHLYRQKVRIRSYVDSGLCFLEVKTKNNHRRTRKKRIAVSAFNPTWRLSPEACALWRGFAMPTAEGEACRAFLARRLHAAAPDRLLPVVENRFRRVTLVNNRLTERVTIDTGLAFHHLQTGRDRQLDHIVVIELKRDGLQPSPLLEMLLRLRIHPMGFSKCCIGTALTDPGLPQNRLKARIRQVEKMEAGLGAGGLGPGAGGTHRTL